MKTALYLLVCSVLLTTQSLKAEYDTDSIGSETLIPAKHRFELSGTGDYIDSAKIKKSGTPSSHISYYQATGMAGYTWLYSPCCQEGIRIGAGYSVEHLGWRKNPFFDQQTFKNVNISLGFTTSRAEKWLILAEATANINADNFKIRRYSSYDLLFWTRYCCRCNLGFHAGFFAQTGMKIDHIYPILGVDWKPSRKWTVNLIFPVNVSCSYNFNKCLALSLAGRYFTSRNRASDDEDLPEAIAYYRNVGGELALTYVLGTCIEANVHAGYTFGGELRISDKKDKNKKHFDIDSAPYAGGELTLRY